MASVVYLIRSVWTSSWLSSALTSNLPCLLVPFGLQHTFPPLQRPICFATLSLLDFSIPPLRFNVQSASQHFPFWTSAYLPSASTSNLPCLLVPFGLPRAFPPLQRPIRHATSSLLDFSIPSLRFNVQSAVLVHPFWTSSCHLSASTSNLPRFLISFGLQHTFPPLQRPIHRACSSLLDFLVPYLHFKVQSSVLAHQSDSPLVHRKKGARKLTLPHSLFPMDQRGVEPLSENPFPVLLLS